MRERENLSHDFFSLAMRPHLSGVMVVGENCGSRGAYNNFYGVLDEETDDLFLEFDDAFNNIGSSLVGNTLDDSQPSPRRRQHFQNLELERYVQKNRKILISIAPGVKKSISPHVVWFKNTISALTQDTFLVRCLKLVDVPSEYIEVVKSGLQQWFVFDFTYQALNRFVEHQMLTTCKEFREHYHRHFKQFYDPEQARVHSLNRLEKSRTNKAVRVKQPYNRSSGTKPFLQRQYELTKRMRMRIPNPPQNILNHSSGMRYARPFWVDDRTTQKVLVGTPSLSLRMRVAVLRLHICKKCTL
ncbi:CACTA en-spm transposon protein [Cucumis melo var. makuwa]|uniref:CACTA en-spm transposon protein n=2 Tax=Cucumis melo TaxID=3656 RepID=A0A5A7USM7_CUCMM|nr:CACTA en-spm transposon protein [Cucumis melo var. makuwa]TYK27149.1 CACTA en-spm transposon protein [Cucumis melo var. makuwa]